MAGVAISGVNVKKERIAIVNSGSLYDEIASYVSRKTSKNKWDSQRVAKQCRNRQSRGNNNNHHHRQKRYYHNSHIAQKGIISTNLIKNVKDRRRRSTNNILLNECYNDIYNNNQSNLEIILNENIDKNLNNEIILNKNLVIFDLKNKRRWRKKN